MGHQMLNRAGQQPRIVTRRTIGLCCVPWRLISRGSGTSDADAAWTFGIRPSRLAKRLALEHSRQLAVSPLAVAEIDWPSVRDWNIHNAQPMCNHDAQFLDVPNAVTKYSQALPGGAILCKASSTMYHAVLVHT